MSDYIADLKGNETAFIEILNQLNKAPKQRETLLQLITLETQLQEKPLKVADFVKQGATNAVLKSLAEKEQSKFISIKLLV